MPSGLRDLPEQFHTAQYLSESGVGRTVVTLLKGEQIFAQGDDCGPIFHINQGTVKLSVVSKLGKVATIALLKDGEFLGEECMLREQRFMSATATALTECVLTRIAKAEMARVLRDEPEMSATLLCYLVRRNGRIQADLTDQLFNSSERRLARTLTLLAHCGESGNGQNLVPQVSQETLAAMIGCTRSRVNFFLNRFRRLGLIEYSDRIRVKRGLLDFLEAEDH